MRNIIMPVALASTLAVAAGAALSQPMMAPGGFMHGARPGMMGDGPGGAWGFTDPASYLDGLRADLGITAAQQPAWQEYAETVKGVAAQMQGVRQTMYDAMGTATWQERRDMMNSMFGARQQAFDTVHAAAEKLLPALDAAQRAKAERRIPGLVGPGYGMMGRAGPK